MEGGTDGVGLCSLSPLSFSLPPPPPSFPLTIILTHSAFMSLLFPLQTGKAAAEVADLHKRDTGLICPPDREQGNSKKKKKKKQKKERNSASTLEKLLKLKV